MDPPLHSKKQEPSFIAIVTDTTMAASDYGFTEEDMVVDKTLGYPKAFEKLARSRNVGPYSLGPPFTFTPYSLQQDEVRVLLDQLEMPVNREN